MCTLSELQLLEGGFIEYWKKIYWPKLGCQRGPQAQHRTFMLKDVTGVFFFLGIGLILSVSVLLCEHLFTGFRVQNASMQQASINSLSASHSNWCTATLLNRIITAQWEGMGDVGSARYESALLPPCPTIRALCYSNRQRSTHSHQQFKGYKITLDVYYCWF